MRRLATLIVLAAGLFSAGLFSGAAFAGVADTIPVPGISPFALDKRGALIRSFGQPGLEYLETLKGLRAYKAPSELDPRFTIAFYVNATGRGPQAQRMWVLQREKVGGAWSLGMWDKRYWRRKGMPVNIRPPFSWLVSTGKHYRGDRKSGPTPSGVYTIDERKYRMARGYTVPGMINVTYLDLHYSSGRRSGVAFHGTTRSKYRRLGRIDSHGCIRMTQSNALAVINRMTGRDGVLGKEMRWGDVPRFWTSERGGRRFGYNRDGTVHPVPDQVVLMSGEAGKSRDETRFPRVLTKTGYRTVVVIFRN